MSLRGRENEGNGGVKGLGRKWRLGDGQGEAEHVEESPVPTTSKSWLHHLAKVKRIIVSTNKQIKCNFQ